MYIQLVSLLLTLSFLTTTYSEEILIHSKNGKLLGLKQYTANGKVFYSFTNIPYAKPPLGDLRFKPPQETSYWRGTRAVSFAPICYQWTSVFGVNNFFGVEDCLYLNVFTPEPNENAKLPVVVCIHGGEFQHGSSYECPLANNFMENDVVFVSFNYRLGILGFLSTGDENLPGNYGLKDQAAALKWVHQNIITFGGNPDSVTLLGQNAGAISVHLHMYSELSKGLFHAAISQSGTALVPWAIVPAQVAKNRTNAIANLVKCSNKSILEMVNCLKKVHGRILVESQPKLFTWYFEPQVLFSPTIESDVLQSGQFLTSDPWTSAEINYVPWLLGFNSGEGVLKAASFLANNKPSLSELNGQLDIALQTTLLYGLTAKPEEVSEITAQIKQHYFNNEEIGVSSAISFIDLMGHSLVMYGCMRTATRYNQTKYFYLFDHLITNSLSNVLSTVTGLEDIRMVSHGDEFITLFMTPPPNELADTTNDFEVSKRMFSYWINFIKRQNPNDNDHLKWESVRSSKFEYLHIKTTEDQMEANLLEEMFQFWDNLPLHESLVKSTETTQKDEL